MLAFAGLPFLSRNFIIMCFTRKRNLEYQRAIVGPGHKNKMDLQKCSLNCPGYSKNGPVLGSDHVFHKSAVLVSADWLLVPTEWSVVLPRCLACLSQGFLTNLWVWNISLRLVELCLQTYDHGRALWFGPVKSSYFCPSFSHDFSKAPKILTSI